MMAGGLGQAGAGLLIVVLNYMQNYMLKSAMFALHHVDNLLDNLARDTVAEGVRLPRLLNH